MTHRTRLGSSRRLASGALLLAVAVTASLPGPAAAQWVSEPGEGWIQASIFHQNTRTKFDRDRDRESLNLQGEAINTVTFVTLNLGLLPGIDLWVQAPWQRVQFNDISQDRVQTGFGDTRVWLRAAPLRYFGISLPLAIRGGAKFAVSDFRVDSEVISLTDGQRDVELMMELGHSFAPSSYWVSGWVGYRWRDDNEQILREFGDQAFFLVQGGGDLTSRLGWKVVAEGFDGRIPVIEGFPVESAERELYQITPWVSVDVGPGQMEVGGQIPLFGRNQLAGPSFVVGYFTDYRVPWPL